MQGAVKIGIEVGKADFSKASQDVAKFARDTGKALDSATRARLELNIADATIKTQALKSQLKDFQGTIEQRKQLIIDTNNAQSNLTEAKRKLQNFTNTGDESLSRLQTKFNNVGASVKNMFQQFVGWTAIALGIKKLGESIVTLTNNLEQNKIAFTTMLGSEEKAIKLLKDLSNFASKTPFTIPGIRDNAKQLLAMGVATENLLPTLKMLGDISAGLGVPLERLTLAYGQVLAKGRLQGGELKQFLEAGVPLVAQLSEQLGVSSGEFYRLVESGQVSSQQVTKALEDMTLSGGKFNDLMSKQAQSIGGLWSNLQDTFTQLGEKIGTQFLPQMKNFVNSVLDFVTNFGDAMGNVAVDTVSTIGNIISTAGQGFADLFNLLSDNTNKTADQQITVGQTILLVWQGIVNGLKVVIFGITTVGKVAGQIIAGVYLSFTSFIKSAANVVIDSLNFIQKALGGAGKMARFTVNKDFGPDLGMGDLTKEIGRDFDKMSGDITASFDKIKKTTSSAKEGVNSFGKIDLSKINGALKEVGTSASSTSKEAKNSVKGITDSINTSEKAFEDYQKAIEDTKGKIKDLRDSAINDIADINWELKGLQNTGADKLAERYAEVVSRLAGGGLDANESSKLIEEKAFLEGKVSQELRDQAVAYSQLSEGQKIYKDNQQEIADLQEKQSIAKAFLAGNISTTKEGGIGFKDDNDPTKIIAITNLKNQQYALDLINKQQSYDNDLIMQTNKAKAELEILTQLNKDKLSIEQKYTKEFGAEVDKQKAIVDGLIAKMRELANAKGSAGATVGSSTTNNSTQNNTINVANNVDIRAVTNVLTKTTR